MSLTELKYCKDACEMLMPLGTASKPNEPDIGYGSEAEVDVSQQPSRKEVGESSRKEVGQSSKNGSGSENGSDSSSVKEKVVEENEVFDLEEVDHEDFDSGSDSDEDVRRKALRKVGRMNQAKISKVEQRRQLWLKKNDKLKVRVVCRGQVPDFANNNMGTIVPVTCNPKGPTSKVQPKSISKKEKVTKPKESYGCPWAMQVSKLPNEEGYWEVKTLKISQKKFEVGVSKQKVFRAKKMAYEKVVCNYTQQYAQLRDYFMELKEINPNTTVKIENPNNGIYPLAYVVVESESKDSWKWFLDCLGDDLELFKNSNFTFISDRQKVDWNGSDLYQVSCPWGDQFVVNMTERVCSCRKWELSGIPCIHAVAAI
ncbi:mutator type transposase [Tanacetum coccineum]|uniref:Mutator type transposase n=1 Tax=Tanacetum coccineum TaxID=301880 RepID=A0ABQ5FTC8_9ASTR